MSGSAQKSAQERALLSNSLKKCSKEGVTQLSAQKSAQKSGSAQKSAQERALLSDFSKKCSFESLKRALKRGGCSKECYFGGELMCSKKCSKKHSKE